MKHTILTQNNILFVSLSLEDLFREYLKTITDIMWDCPEPKSPLGFNGMVETNIQRGIQALRNGNSEYIRRMFQDGESPLLLGDLMTQIETWVENKQAFFLIIPNPRDPNNPILVNGDWVNF